MINVSVIICTYNRAESLRETLACLGRQDLGGLSCEFIIVDNRSTDHTQDVIEHFVSTSIIPTVSILEKRQGLSYARNTAILQAKGEVLAFTDDDVWINPEWVRSLWACFCETNADAVGGKIERAWICSKPRWYSDEIGGPLICQDQGEYRKKWVDHQRHIVGANMAIRQSVFAELGLFSEELGRRGDALLGGEDREYFQRIAAGDFKIYYEPTAVIAHKVEPERVTRAFFRQWFRDIGRTLGYQIPKSWHHILTVAPIWLWSKTFSTGWQNFTMKFARSGSEGDKFAGELWSLHYQAMLYEKFLNWLPFGIGKKWSPFAARKRSQSVKVAPVLDSDSSKNKKESFVTTN